MHRAVTALIAALMIFAAAVGAPLIGTAAAEDDEYTYDFETEGEDEHFDDVQAVELEFGDEGTVDVTAEIYDTEDEEWITVEDAETYEVDGTDDEADVVAVEFAEEDVEHADEIEVTVSGDVEPDEVALTHDGFWGAPPGDGDGDTDPAIIIAGIIVVGGLVAAAARS